MYKFVKKTFLNSLLLKNEQCSHTNYALNLELQEMTGHFNQQVITNQRLNYLLAERCYGHQIYLKHTSKHEEVLISMDFKVQQLEIFDLVNVPPHQARALLIWWQRDGDEIYIKDIQGGNNKGHGSLGLTMLINWCLENDIKRLYGFLVDQDRDHADRLIHFYHKMGFQLTLFNDSTKRNEYAMIERFFNP